MNRISLFKMSFLYTFQYFLHGMWSMTLGLVLSTNGLAEMIKITFVLLSVATIISPLLIGYITDRSDSPKKVYGTLHFVNGINFSFIFLAFYLNYPFLIVPLILMSGLLYYPTTSLIGSLTFQNIYSDNQFPIIRSFGSLGFMAAGFVMGFYRIEGSYYLFLVASILSIALALLLIFIKLKDNAVGKRSKVGLLNSLNVAYSLIKKSNAMPAAICAVLLMFSQVSYNAFIPVYLVDLGVKAPTTIMQVSVFTELIMMLILPFFLLHFRIERLIIVAVFLYVLRNVLFWVMANDYALSTTIFALTAQGVGWVLFYVVFDVLVKKISTTDNLHQMQSLKVILINGVGSALAAAACGLGYSHFVLEGNRQDWQSFWLVPISTSVAAAILLLVNRKGIFS